jgi:hypothetical protein
MRLLKISENVDQGRIDDGRIELGVEEKPMFPWLLDL